MQFEPDNGGGNNELESRSKSELYGELLPALNSGQVELLDNERLRRQLCSLERRVHAGGRQSIDHPARGHDDLINGTAGVLVQLGPSAVPGMLAWLAAGCPSAPPKGTGRHSWEEALKRARMNLRAMKGKKLF